MVTINLNQNVTFANTGLQTNEAGNITVSLASIMAADAMTN